MGQRYGVSGRLWWSVCGASAVGWLTCAVKLLNDHSIGTGGKFAILGGAAALFGLVLAWTWRTATLVDHSHIEVRGLWSSKRLAWPDIQAIRIELNPGAFASKKAPDEMVVVYDDRGRRIGLPHLNEKNLGPRSLHDEVGALRRTWIEQRGTDWLALPQVSAKVAERRRHPVSPWAMGLIAMVATVPITVVLLIAGLVLGLSHGPVASLFFKPEGMVGVQIVAGGVTVAVSSFRRRQRRRLQELER